MKGKFLAARWTRILAIGGVLVLAVLSAVFWPKILSGYYRQMGAIALNKALAESQTNPERAQWHLSVAEADYLKALKTDSSDTDSYVKRGVVSLSSGQTGPARDLLQTAVQQRPDDRLAQFWLGAVLLRMGDIEGAAEEFRDAGAFGQLLALGAQRFDAGRYGEATYAFQMAVATNPRNADAYRKLGMAAEHQGNTREAVAAYSKYLELDKRNLLQRYLLQGRIGFLEKRWAEVVTSNERVLQLATAPQRTAAANPALSAEQAADVHYWLGIAYKELGMPEDALRELKEAARLVPDYKWYQRAIADIYFDRGELRDSLNWYRSVSRLDPTDGTAGERLRALGALD